MSVQYLFMGINSRSDLSSKVVPLESFLWVKSIFLYIICRWYDGVLRNTKKKQLLRNIYTKM